METGRLAITARYVMHFIVTATNAEIARAMPDITAAQIEAIRSGRARLTGDTNNGLEYVENSQERPSL